ncbi:unnamed protein product [Discula destructiva]
MTRLPSDSFLPSGAMEPGHVLSLAGLASSPSAHISPLSLHGGAHYFDAEARPSVTSCPTSTTTPTHQNNRRPSRDPPRAQPASFLSPHLTPIPSHTRYRLPISKNSQQRAASLSPTRYPTDKRRGFKMDNIPEHATPRVTSSATQVPVDTISGTGSGLITVRRPAMRVDSKVDFITGDTQPVEQGYRKLEKLRQAFDDERRYLQANRDRAEETHKEILDEMEKDHALERAQWEADKYELQKQIMQLQKRLKEVEAGSHLRLATYQLGSSSQLSPLDQADLSPLASLERNSIDSTLAMDNQEPTKVIDVQEYHKDLEGIHLKENFVKKETFTDTPTSAGSRESSGKVSPPSNLEDCKSAARANTILALKADASSRLTMHAGHTPTVSLSIAHTGTSNTVVSSGSNTPTLMMSGDGAMSAEGNERAESSEPAEPVHTGIDDQDPDIMEPSDEDPELRGPLTLRNMPAKDELFLSRLADKLEKVTSGEDATPAVLKHSDDESVADEHETTTQQASAESKTSDAQDAEEDIPLKIRLSSYNFGKPFGQA